MKLLDSDLTCDRCGESLKCLLTGPEREPHTRATYLCENDNGRGCQGPGWYAAQMAAFGNPTQGEEG